MGATGAQGGGLARAILADRDVPFAVRAVTRDALVGQRVGISGENLTGPEMANQLGRAIGKEVRFFDMPFDMYRGLGFPGADDLGNMFEFQALLGDEFLRSRDPKRSRQLNPALLDFDAWLAANASRIPLG